MRKNFLAVIFRLVCLVFLFSTSLSAESLATHDNGLALRAFQRCISEGGVHTLAQTIECLPKDCDWFYLNSSSAQNACVLDVQGPGCDALQIPNLKLPRLVLMCDGGRFAPTYGFCAKQDRIEMASYQSPKEIFLYEVSFGDATTSMTQIRRSDPSKNCSSCHFYFDPDNVKPDLHAPIPIDARLILGRGRSASHIQTVCSTIQKATDLGCSLSGVYQGASNSLDSQSLRSLCSAIVLSE